ncbi:MAG: hypothetical protein OZX49_02376 [Immundisolibacter sp.]|nr:hypothetical protein [Immundisolibacter sp.]
MPPIDSDTPCSTSGKSRRTRSSTASGLPPATMKFSEIASNQSTPAGAAASRSAKCSLRRPRPKPSGGNADMDPALNAGPRRRPGPTAHSDATVPPAALHSASVIAFTPLPLQAFWPLQALLAVAQSL